MWVTDNVSVCLIMSLSNSDDGKLQRLHNNIRGELPCRFHWSPADWQTFHLPWVWLYRWKLQLWYVTHICYHEPLSVFVFSNVCYCSVKCAQLKSTVHVYYTVQSSFFPSIFSWKTDTYFTLWILATWLHYHQLCEGVSILGQQTLSKGTFLRCGSIILS